MLYKNDLLLYDIEMGGGGGGGGGGGERERVHI